MTTDERQTELLQQVFHGELPPCTAQPCNECPWRRDSTPGYTGPFTATAWVEAAHADTPIMCHQTLRGEDHDFTDPEIRQCRGAAIFRANVHKQPRNSTAVTGPVDITTVFEDGYEMIDHHENLKPAVRIHEYPNKCGFGMAVAGHTVIASQLPLWQMWLVFVLTGTECSTAWSCC